MYQLGVYSNCLFLDSVCFYCADNYYLNSNGECENTCNGINRINYFNNDCESPDD